MDFCPDSFQKRQPQLLFWAVGVDVWKRSYHAFPLVRNLNRDILRIEGCCYYAEPHPLQRNKTWPAPSALRWLVCWELTFLPYWMWLLLPERITWSINRLLSFFLNYMTLPRWYSPPCTPPASSPYWPYLAWRGALGQADCQNHHLTIVPKSCWAKRRDGCMPQVDRAYSRWYHILLAV